MELKRLSRDILILAVGIRGTGARNLVRRDTCFLESRIVTGVKLENNPQKPQHILSNNDLIDIRRFA
jgi:hypothetical protein